MGYGRPALNCLPSGVYAIDIPWAVNSSSGNIEETTSEFFNFCTFSKDTRRLQQFTGRRIAGERQPGEFTLPYFDVVGFIVNRVVEGHLAVAVAMDVAKSYVTGICNRNRVREGLIGAYDTIHVQVCNGDIARIPDVERQGESRSEEHTSE